jgi:urease accessory protein
MSRRGPLSHSERAPAPGPAPAPAPAAWHGQLHLQYHHDGHRTVARPTHEGPLRVLKALYPEGDAVCHHVLVHPPSGMVGGDSLRIQADLGPQAHALITTPGATRFYRSLGPTASQSVMLTVASGARLEWLPLETIVYPQARAQNQVRMRLEHGATMIGWDVVCLGLPASNAPFASSVMPPFASPAAARSAQGGGVFEQHLEVAGAWLERAAVRANDTRLLQSPLGFAGFTVMATAWVCGGAARDVATNLGLVDVARDALAGVQGPVAVTQSQPTVVVLRMLAHEAQAVWPVLRAVRLAWRQALWGLEPNEPRVWGNG